MKKVNILGCAWSQVPLVFDLVNETLGIRDFRILKNISVENDPGQEINAALYKFSLHEPDESVSLKDSLTTFGVTSPKAKLAVFSYFKFRYGLTDIDLINIIHPASYIATSALLDKGIIVEPGVIISSQARIGFGVTLKRGVNIGHNTEIGDYTEINPGVITSGYTSVGRGCIIGVGSVLKNRIKIGENTFIGMGSVVTGDIPAGVIAYGNPCKVIRQNDLWQI